ncbi:hypothetical protein O181_042494 [Austropuccinia psidii MF-1]|uniref:Uncharacterized protein n=1 Tax=Austropuccinia psidii MF-1 TaxID=1389203 RepID=A0A9Q3HHI7_9BASI|nr:hypothetical protein [Austropuccinia psidii MF-1]
MSLKAQTHFNTIRNFWVISPHWLPTPQHLACLRPRTALKMRLQHCPPSPSSPLLTLSHPHPDHPYAHRVASRHHLSLRLCSALPTCSQHCLPSLHLRSALPILLTILMLSECPPDMLPTLLTILTLTEFPPDMLLTLLTILTLTECPPNMLPTLLHHPYACGVPSQHAPSTTYPYAFVVPSQHAPNTTYPYTDGVPSQHCLPSLRSHSALPTCSKHHLSLRLCSALLACLQHSLPSLRSQSSLPTCSKHCLPSLRSRSALLTCS